MLVLTRKPGERVILDGRITVEVLEVSGNRVLLGIQAPAEVAVARQELLRGVPEVHGREARVRFHE
jgi:carbon storage regulator